MDHHDLKEFFDGSDWRSEASSFYSGLRSVAENELEDIESGIEASITPPNICVFAPVEKLEQSLTHHFNQIDSVSNADILTGMSVFLGWNYEELVSDEVAEMCFYFYNEYNDHRISKIAGYFNYLKRNDLSGYHSYTGRFFPEENFFALNHFRRNDLPKDVPEFLVPARNFLEANGSGNVREVIVHELTHAYIENKSKFRKRTRTISTVDEAAAQAVSNVFDAGNIPSSQYYEDNARSQEVMQAARQVFLSSIDGKNTAEAVSTVRREAVEAIDKIVDGEDPVRALRSEDNIRSKIVRIASYSTKRMAEDVVRDLAVIGITKPYQKHADISESLERKKEIDRVWGDIKEIDTTGKYLHAFAHNSRVKDELVEPTEELSQEARKIHDVITSDYEDILQDTSVLDDIFGESSWTDPAFPPDDQDLVDYITLILESYDHLIRESVSRAEKLESATEHIHGEGEKLVSRYENEEAAERVKNLMQETEQLYEGIDEVRQNLEEAEEMAEIGLKKIEKLKEN